MTHGSFISEHVSILTNNALNFSNLEDGEVYTC